VGKNEQLIETRLILEVFREVKRADLQTNFATAQSFYAVQLESEVVV
jgi:hypothetical protein